MLLPQDFCSKTMQAVTGQPIKNFNFFSNSPEFLFATNRWPKSLRTLGTRLPTPSVVPRVLRLFGQRLVARRDSGVLEFYYHRISAVKTMDAVTELKQSSQSKKKKHFFEFSRVSPCANPLTKRREDSGYEIDLLRTSSYMNFFRIQCNFILYKCTQTFFFIFSFIFIVGSNT